MPDLIPWEYGGHTFHVAATMSDAAKDRACATLLSEFDSRRARNTVPLPKPLEPPVKVIPSESDQSPLEGRRSALEETQSESPDPPLYDQGFYRKPCRECGKGITRTGKRGRAPIQHQTCED